jgi:COP9 signalosome complex subunit 2
MVAEADSTAKGAELGEWHFKALKNIIKIRIRMNDIPHMLEAFARLLESINGGAVTRNRAEKAINGILDLVSSSTAIESATLQDVYTTTLTALTQSAGNERLCFKIRIKLAKLFLSQSDWKHLKELLNELIASLTTTRSGDVIDERSKGTQLMEVYALQIQMYTAMNDIKRLSDAYRKALSVSKAAVPHPGITGIIYECGGKMYMQERDWDSSRLQFLEAFKAYDEAGQTNKTLACLKYMLLANMLSASRINPFDSQEAKAYEKDPSIAAMTQLTDAYLANDIAAFEPILKRHSSGLAADDFMRTYLDDLMTTIRTQVRGHVRHGRTTLYT